MVFANTTKVCMAYTILYDPLCYEQSNVKGTRAIFTPSVLACVYNPFESTCNGAVGQMTEDVLPAHTD